MTVASCLPWDRSELDVPEREKLLGAFTPEQRHRLLQSDCVWMERCGVIWQPREGVLRRPEGSALASRP